MLELIGVALLTAGLSALCGVSLAITYWVFSAMTGVGL